MNGPAPRGFSRLVRILIAEDNPDITRIVSYYLRNMRNTEVLACANGEAAIAALSYTEFDIAILDGAMPGTDGVAVLAWLRAQPRTASLPVIFLTADARRDFEQTCLAAGAQLVMTKPFNPGELVRNIRSLLPGV